MTAAPESVAAARIAGAAAAEKLATDVVAIDVSEQLAITDVFVIASADNERQVNSIVDEVEETSVATLRRVQRVRTRWWFSASLMCRLYPEIDRVAVIDRSGRVIDRLDRSTRLLASPSTQLDLTNDRPTRSTRSTFQSRLNPRTAGEAHLHPLMFANIFATRENFYKAHGLFLRCPIPDGFAFSE